MKLIILFTIILANPILTWGQVGLETIQQKLNRPFFAIVYVNDCNQMLGKEIIHKENCASDDLWYTLGVQLKAGIPLKRFGLFLDAFAKSDLYTQSAGESYVENGRTIKPESFTELDEFGVSIRPYKISKNFSLSVDVTGGIINKDKPIQYMALWVQAGEDGRGGYHEMVQNAGKDNISREKMKLFFDLKPKIQKLIVLIDDKKKPFYALVSIGADISNIKAMNNINSSIQLTLPLIGRSRYFPIELTAETGLVCSAHSTGVSVTPNVGIDLTFFQKLVIKLNTTYPLGTVNSSLYDVKIQDHLEPLLNATIKFNIKK